LIVRHDGGDFRRAWGYEGKSPTRNGLIRLEIKEATANTLRHCMLRRRDHENREHGQRMQAGGRRTPGAAEGSKQLRHHTSNDEAPGAKKKGWAT
jgi:hypothetical protein